MNDDANSLPAEADKPTSEVTNNKRRWLFGGLAVLATLLAWNATVYVPVSSALSEEDSHSLVAYRSWFVSPSTIVLDVRDVDMNGSMADMDRLLFKAAEALKDRQYDTVVLAHNGTGRFIVDGAHFQDVGQSYSYQNPVYLMRTFTENVSNMDGTPAFGTWTGGWLGVLGEQLNDHNEFHQEWWVRPSMGLD